MPSLPLVTIAIVNWNGLSHTRECVRHCLGLDYPNCELVIVDNGSRDGSLEALTAEWGTEPRITLLAAGRNLGFSGANNLVLARALRRGVDFVWLLNNDTKVNPTTLRALVEAAQDHPRAGILGSKILLWDHPDTLWFAGGSIDKNGFHLSLHRGLGEIDRGQYDNDEEVEFITGCSLLIRAATLRDIHLLSEEYFLYWEDVDWCKRARQAGWTCLYVPRSTLLHRVGASFENKADLQRRYEARNRLLYHWRFDKARVLEILWSIAHFSVRAALNGNPQPARAPLLGAWDFVRGRKGKMRERGAPT